jgi:hypothetical protein
MQTEMVRLHGVRHDDDRSIGNNPDDVLCNGRVKLRRPGYIGPAR